MIPIAFAVFLLALWILAWGQLTIANLASGLIVGAILLLAFPLRQRDARRLRFSASGFVRLVSDTVIRLIASNVAMTRQILQARTARRAGVLAHRLRSPSEQVATAMSSIIALSPGTMTVDVESDSSVIYVHFFDLHDIDAARASLGRLERLVTDAIATPADQGDVPQDEEEP